MTLRLILSFAFALSSAFAGVIDFSVLQPRNNYDPVVAGDADTSDLHLSYRTLNSDFSQYSTAAGFWNTGYSNFPAAIFPQYNGGILEITLTPVGFSTVRLNSFAVGSYGGATEDSIFRVTDGAGNILWDAREPYTFGGTGGNGETVSPNVQASSLKILMGTNWNLGPNYINYDSLDASGVPEPGTLALLGSAVGLLALRRKLRA